MPTLILFVAGALLGTALDHLHVAGGVLGYPRPAFWGEAWWVFPLFGTAAVALCGSWRLAFRGAAPRTGDGRPVVFFVLLFAGAYATSVGLRATPWLALAAMTVVWLPFARRFGLRYVAYACLSAAGGCLVESALQWADLFHYRAPGLMGFLPVPVWLPGLYLHATLATRALDEAFFAPRAAAIPVAA